MNTTYTKRPLYFISVLGDVPARQDPITFTSSLYPFKVADTLHVGNPSIVGALLTTSYFIKENLNVPNPAVLSGVLHQVEITHTNPPDVLYVLNAAVLSGILQQIEVYHTNPPENVNVFSPVILSGIIQQVAIGYSHWIPENVSVINPSILSGTLV